MESQNRPVVIITGGTRGIGSGIAEMFAFEGYSLILGYRENLDAAEKFKTHLLEKYGNDTSCCLKNNRSFEEVWCAVKFLCKFINF